MTIPNACNGGKIWRWNFQCFLSLHDLLIFIDILFTIQYQNSINFQLYNFKKHIGMLRLEFEPEDTRFRRRRILRAMSTPELPIIDLSDKRTGAYNSNCITKLLWNFRSHAKLLELPSKMFYDSELVPKADPVLTESLLRYSNCSPLWVVMAICCKYVSAWA